MSKKGYVKEKDFLGARVYTSDGIMYQYVNATSHEISGSAVVIFNKRHVAQAIFCLSQIKRIEWKKPNIEKRVTRRKKK